MQLIRKYKTKTIGQEERLSLVLLRGKQPRRNGHKSVEKRAVSAKRGRRLEGKKNELMNKNEKGRGGNCSNSVLHRHEAAGDDRSLRV